MQILKQKQYSPQHLCEQIFVIFLGVKGLLDQLESNKIQKIADIESFWYLFLEFAFPGLILNVLKNDKINGIKETGHLFTSLNLI